MIFILAGACGAPNDPRISDDGTAIDAGALVCGTDGGAPKLLNGLLPSPPNICANISSKLRAAAAVGLGA